MAYRSKLRTRLDERMGGQVGGEVGEIPGWRAIGWTGGQADGGSDRLVGGRTEGRQDLQARVPVGLAG